MYQAINASAAGAFMVGVGGQALGGASLKAGADAATAIIREGGAGGRILAVLGAGAGLADHWSPQKPVHFAGSVFVVLTGTAPTLILYAA